MNKLLALLTLSVGTTLLGGCASSLKTFDAEKKPSIGIPIGTPVLVKITKETTYEVDPISIDFVKYCTSDIDETYEFLPLGERSYIAFEPAALGKGEFKVEFTDSGALKAVSLNSDATAGAQAVTDFLKTVLPFVAAQKTAVVATTAYAPLDGDTAQNKKNKYCIKKETKVTSVERINIK